jgi:predicted GH43/DUF377 family glycosyl hydrolase
MFTLQKYSGNPILSPLAEHSWENFSVCNPGACFDQGIFRLLYRAAGNDAAHRIHFGLAVSEDGFCFTRTSATPVFSPSFDGPDAGCVEDPRIVRFGADYFISYAYRIFPPGRYWLNHDSAVDKPKADLCAPRFVRENLTASGLVITRDFKSFQRLGRITPAHLDDRDVVLFPEKVRGRFVMLHRPREWVGQIYGCDYPSIWISFSDDLLHWDNNTLLAKNTFPWETKIGAASPPIKTQQGWLTFYHAVDKKGVYRVGAVLLDIENPKHVLARVPHPLLEPQESYELNGLYSGCVFPTGNVVIGDMLFVYYGAADRVCCVATASMKELLSYLSQFPVISGESLSS